MKTKLLYSLAFALAVTLAATGCRHKPGYLTKLHAGETPRTATDYPPGTFPGPVINPEPIPTSMNGISEPTREGFYQGMAMDRAALAAYTIHFAFDSAVIRDSERASLQSVASALTSQAGTKLLIEGDCDERGTEEYNRSLGERRALAAREALAKLGVDPMRIMTISYGKDKPADPGHDEAAWKQNRRDDFVLLRPKPGV